MDERTRTEDPSKALEEIMERLATSDPDVLRAVSEVDRSLIRSQLARSPLARLNLGVAFARGLSRFSRVDALTD